MWSGAASWLCDELGNGSGDERCVNERRARSRAVCHARIGFGMVGMMVKRAFDVYEEKGIVH